MILYYIRHGDPIYNPDSLTPLGKRQAEAIGKRLALYGIDKIYTSTSVRAYETAQPTAEMTKTAVTKIEHFNESYAWDYFTAATESGGRFWAAHIPKYRQMFVSDEVMSCGHKWYEHPCFADNTFKAGVEFFDPKIDEFMLELGYEHDRRSHSYKKVKESPKRVAVFAHEGFGGVFLSSVLDIPYPIFITRHSMSHTGMTVIEFNDKDDIIIPTMLTYSADGHLYKEGLPTYHSNRVPI